MKNYIAHSRKNDGATQSVKEHLLQTAQRAAEFAEIFDGKEAAYVCGLLHDIGKYSDEFHKRITAKGKRCDHATAGAQKLYECDEGAGLLLGYIMMGHHGGLPDYGCNADSESDGTYSSRLKKNVPDYSAYQRDFTDEQFTISRMPSIKYNKDWGFKTSFMVRMLYSCVVDADFLDTESFMQNGQVDRAFQSDFYRNLSGEAHDMQLFHEMQKRLEEKISRFSQDTAVNCYRQKILNDCIAAAEQKCGVFQLTVPTGGGKTIASAAFAVKHILYNPQSLRRIIYVIPFCSIIEQNAKVFADIFGEGVILEHHSNYDFDSSENEYNNQKKLASENWDMPFIVTTNVQFFESLYSNKPSRCRKLHNIAGSVIIFDEVQAIPTKYLESCIRAIEELVAEYRCSAVFCSATQPGVGRFFKEKLPINEICKDRTQLFEALKRTRLTDLRERELKFI